GHTEGARSVSTGLRSCACHRRVGRIRWRGKDLHLLLRYPVLAGDGDAAAGGDGGGGEGDVRGIGRKDREGTGVEVEHNVVALAIQRADAIVAARLVCRGRPVKVRVEGAAAGCRGHVEGDLLVGRADGGGVTTIQVARRQH